MHITANDEMTGSVCRYGAGVEPMFVCIGVGIFEHRVHHGGILAYDDITHYLIMIVAVFAQPTQLSRFHIRFFIHQFIRVVAVIMDIIERIGLFILADKHTWQQVFRTTRTHIYHACLRA